MLFLDPSNRRRSIEEELFVMFMSEQRVHPALGVPLNGSSNLKNDTMSGLKVYGADVLVESSLRRVCVELFC